MTLLPMLALAQRCASARIKLRTRSVQKRVPTRSAGTIISVEKISPDARANAPRWHAFRDAPRHNSVPHRALNFGRRAPKNAFPRGALSVIHTF
ncbi:DUF1534 domain-containing protein [Pseudomonas syringae]|uniref:DUF1534 domain-containing protein n=1 Tax=Pseudomonas syringae TaxID=317 RepID=A0A9Q4A6P7_PSESX|nr:DUF1534 domain-containing protein [Pseudomonas syringae]MCF5484538.1 DUF1534 domain-containing protein [Pseudomonas syringae]MCF5491674.1 DUF1534 domain-containing protein [Pseudomonas syringae]MCF5504560.1 DUF1534 domain-containing protein [Pseudomonas syringae]MCF5521723.1 DUF1534 domain-containing protein [Pseudomonas syringae]